MKHLHKFRLRRQLPGRVGLGDLGVGEAEWDTQMLDVALGVRVVEGRVHVGGLFVGVGPVAISAIVALAEAAEEVGASSACQVAPWALDGAVLPRLV